MKISRILLTAAVLIGVVFLLVAAVQAPTLTHKRPAVNISKLVINRNLIVTYTTGVQGNLTITGSLPTQLNTMSCADLKVFVGKWVTPPNPGGGYISIPEFQSAQSAAATGSMPNCSYAVHNVPAGQQYDIMVTAAQRFACDVTDLSTQPSNVKLTFTKGQMQTQNYQVKMICVHVN